MNRCVANEWASSKSRDIDATCGFRRLDAGEMRSDLQNLKRGGWRSNAEIYILWWDAQANTDGLELSHHPLLFTRLTVRKSKVVVTIKANREKTKLTRSVWSTVIWRIKLESTLYRLVLSWMRTSFKLGRYPPLWRHYTSLPLNPSSALPASPNGFSSLIRVMIPTFL
jgi:hypothetical protein